MILTSSSSPPLHWVRILGTWSLIFDGSDVEFSTSGENIDGIGLSPTGDLLISTLGTARVAGITARDEDILAFTATSWGETTAGTWSLYFDGSDVRLSAGSEDINGLSLNTNDGTIYFTAKGDFQANSNNQLKGDFDDIAACTEPTTGENSACTFAAIFDGDGAMWRKDIDGITILPDTEPQPTANVQSRDTHVNSAQYTVFDEELALNGNDSEIDSFDRNVEKAEEQLFLPFVVR